MSARVSPTTPCFAAAYTGSAWKPNSPASDAVAMMTPPPRACSRGIACRVPSITALRSISTVRRQFASGLSGKRGWPVVDAGVVVEDVEAAVRRVGEVEHRRDVGRTS